MNTHELSIVSLLHSTVQCQCQWFGSSEQSVSLNICIVLPHLRSIGLHICKFEASLELCSCKKNLNICVILFLIYSCPGPLRLPGTEEPGAGSPHGGPQGDHAQDPLRAVQVRRAGRGVNPLKHQTNVICFIRFDKLREMMGGPRDYRVS